MKTSINLRHPRFGPHLRKWMRERLQIVLGPYGAEVVTANVTVTDENGPRGGVDTRCALNLTTRLFGTISFVVVGEQADQAFKKSLNKARSALKRRLSQRRSHHRGPVSFST